MQIPDNNILDIIISLVLIYALLSILVSILTEWVNQRAKTRSLFLKNSIFKLLSDPLNVHFGELFYNHYLVTGLYNKERKRLPQYISSKLFAEVIIDVIANRTQHDSPIQLISQNDESGKQYKLSEKKEIATVLERFGEGLALLKPSPLSDTLKSFWDKSKDLEEFKANLSFWYDDYMDRVSGWFKYDQRWKLRILGFAVAIALNVDSLHLIKVISLDDKLRSNLVSTAEKVADNYQTLSDTAKKNNSDLMNALHLAIPDSVLTDSTKIAHAGDLLREKDPQRYQQVVKLLRLNDSLSTIYMYKADSVLGIAASLNIPIGWDWSSAPLSWKPFEKSKKELPEGKGILAYSEKRNTFNWSNFFYYLLGISISGISLSFGAPFWFDALVKLINIRKAGKKPEATNTKN
jgi:hypothetical protein